MKKVLIIILNVFLLLLCVGVNTVKLNAYTESTNNINHNGIYYLKNKQTGLYMQSIDLDFIDGGDVMQLTYQNSEAQSFRFYHIYDNKYEIYSIIDSTKLFSIPFGWQDDNLRLKFDTYSGTHVTKNRFQFVDTGDGDNSFYIKTCATSYQKYLVVPSGSGLGAYVVQKSYNSNDYNKWYLEGISINEKVHISLNQNESITLRYLVPDNMLYSVETMKYGSTSVDTVLTVSNTLNGVITDDDGGFGLYSYIGFYGSENRIISITVSLFSANSSGDFYLQIRQQKAALYGFDYRLKDGNFGLNTLPDLTSPYSDLSNLIQTNKYESKAKSHLFEIDDRGFQNGNSELLFFTGHGTDTHGNLVFLKNIDGIWSSDTLLIQDLPLMNQVRIAVFSSCNSAKEVNNTSVVKKAVENHAKSALGFPDSVNSVSATIFTNELFYKLSMGYSLSYSASIASSTIIWPFDNVHDYVIEGNQNIKLINIENRSDLNSIDDDLLLNYYELINSGLYRVFTNRDNSNRYFYTINGFLSNIYVDIKIDDNKDLSFIRGNLNIYDRKIINVLPITIDYISKDNSHIVYFVEDANAIPILIEFKTVSIDGICLEYVKCTNLYDGTIIDYQNICIAEGVS